MQQKKTGSFSLDHLSETELNEALRSTFIDYLGERSIKVFLITETFDTFLYNRDNGDNAAEEAIAELKRSKIDKAN